MDFDGLPTELEEFVRQEIAEGRFASALEVVSAALRLFKEHEAKAKNGQPASNGFPAQTPEDIVDAIAQALGTDAPRRAERLAREGAKRYPEHNALQKYARVLAPPIVRTTPSTPASRAAVKANGKWLKAHRNAYPGHWIALKDGELLHVALTLDELTAVVGDVRGRDILVTKIP